MNLLVSGKKMTRPSLHIQFQQHSKMKFLTMNTPIFVASHCGNVDALLELIKRGDCVNHPGANGVTPLMIAAIYGHEKAVRLLIEHGADVNVSDNDGNTALILAYLNMRWEVARVLIAHDANVNARNKQGRGVGDIQPGRNGYRSGRRNGLKMPVGNAHDINGNTALLTSVSKGVEVVRMLIVHGADVKA
jgi:ankyrin repeat protein